MFTSKRKIVSVIFMILLIAGLSGSSVIAAPMYQDEQEEKPKKEKKEKRNLPLEPARKIEFSTNEGSWMSIDVSPDGNTIVFEMIGDLYTLPISGGKATRITYGMAIGDDIDMQFLGATKFAQLYARLIKEGGEAKATALAKAAVSVLKVG
ncbi:hypothetical protein IIB79_11245, partial [candidate division KSB1 bacterium]|nr:hypothetical protein [candidate division KSB1 bacterium]